MHVELDAKHIGRVEEELEGVVLETIRMFPPFVGGLRVAKTDTKVGR